MIVVQIITLNYARGAMLNIPRHAPHCRVLPPGEFNGKIPKPLPVCYESFITLAATVSHYLAHKETL